jgi:hypothetical protein
VDKLDGDKTLEMKDIYKILKRVKADKNTDDWRKLNLKKTFRTNALIIAVTLILKGARFADTVFPQPMAHQFAPFFHSS